MDPNLFLSAVAFVAFVGSLVSGVIGWLDAGGSFNARTYMSTVLRGLLSAIFLASTFSFDTSIPLFIALATAFLSGAGIDALGNRIAGATKTTSTTPV